MYTYIHTYAHTYENIHFRYTYKQAKKIKLILWWAGTFSLETKFLPGLYCIECNGAAKDEKCSVFAKNSATSTESEYQKLKHKPFLFMLLIESE